MCYFSVLFVFAGRRDGEKERGCNAWCQARVLCVISVCYLYLQEEEMEKRKEDAMHGARLEAEVKELRKENSEFKQYILALQGEVYGARLAAKYLDKELAGR